MNFSSAIIVHIYQVATRMLNERNLGFNDLITAFYAEILHIYITRF